MHQDTIIFKTPGLIDIKAFTCFGMSSKPNTTSPIGYFGTGLKYAIAVLVRNDIAVSVYIGDDEYVFYKKTVKFRSDEFSQVMMKKRRGLLSKWTYETLPFTTQLGRNWELWQAFRELESNTLDEGGYSELLRLPRGDELFTSGGTSIVVTSQDFANLWIHERPTIFLSKAFREHAVINNDTLEVIPESSKYLYYRGLRVYEFPKDMQSACTYNIKTQLELTEDRTIKYITTAEAHIIYALLHATDKELIDLVLGAGDASFEAQLSWEYSYTQPSKEMLKALEAKLKEAATKALAPAQSSRGLSVYDSRLFQYHSKVCAPLPVVVDSSQPWFYQAATYMRANRLDDAWRIIKEHPNAIIDWLNVLCSEHQESQNDDMPF